MTSLLKRNKKTFYNNKSQKKTQSFPTSNLLMMQSFLEDS